MYSSVVILYYITAVHCSLLTARGGSSTQLEGLIKKKRHLLFKSRTGEQYFLIVCEPNLHGNGLQETYVSSPDLSRQISASCTAPLRSSVSSDVTSPVLALLFLMGRTSALCVIRGIV